MKERINNKERVPLAIYQKRYGQLEPEEITRRTGVPFDSSQGVFTLNVLGHKIYASWPEFSLEPKERNACPADLCGGEASVLMIRLLSEGILEKDGGTWLSYRELPWGDVYDKNFQGRCVKRLAFTFGSKLGVFAEACGSLGGKRVDKGDISFDLPFLPGIIVRLIMWAGDDEFPPSSQFLFSDNISRAFTAEDVAVLGEIVIGALKASAVQAAD